MTEEASMKGEKERNGSKTKREKLGNESKEPW